MQLTLSTLGLKWCYRSLRHFMACIFYAASTSNFTEWMSVSHTYRICFIMALLLQSIMNLVSDVWLSRKRCADWMSGVASNKPFVLRRKLSVDWWYETEWGRKEKRKALWKDPQELFTLLSEVPCLCNKAWRVRKARPRVRGKRSARWSCAYKKRGEVKAGQGRRKWMH